MIYLEKNLEGTILDVGGGGEGIIGRLYPEQVIAIDNRQEELDEAPNGFEKILMDATDLKYHNESFDNVTFFFTLMFMAAESQLKAINEAARVLKAKGEMHIWDCDIESAYPEPFIIDIDVNLPKEQISTTYGVGKLDKQNLTSISNMCIDAGLKLKLCENEGNCFYLKFVK